MNFLRRTAKDVRQYKVSMKLLTTALILLVLITSVAYGVAALYKRTGTFTVSVNKLDMNKYGLSLSESRKLNYKSSHLNANIVENITNISFASIDPNVDEIDGEHNGADYIAYTFYLVNTGTEEVNYEYSVGVGNVENALDEAIRIRLYVNGVPTTYAKTRSDGGGHEITGTDSKDGCKEFYSSYLAVNEQFPEIFKPEEVTKFTVVIWIEGDDPDCTDDKIDGRLKVDLSFRIVNNIE